MDSRFGLLVCEGRGQIKNIGDYIQSIAQEQYIPSEYDYVEREHLDEYVSDYPTKVIMNGWFMHNPEKFPPSSDIVPLFISFHIVPRIANQFFTKECITYLKQYEPIGARDISTRDLLEKNGIRSYLSGCLTLCLGKKYKSDVCSQDVYFVDPYYDFSMGKSLKDKVCNLLNIIRFFPKTQKLKSIFVYERGYKLPHNSIIAGIKKLVWRTNFYRTYKTAFSDEVLFNAKYVSHNVPQCEIPSNSEKMELARDLIQKYAKARLVVTSRIHCALPCLGVETPVIFVTSEILEGSGLRSSGRFGGLTELMHVLKYSHNSLIPLTDNIKNIINKGKITQDSKITNSDKYKGLRDDLDFRVSSFVRNE